MSSNYGSLQIPDRWKWLVELLDSIGENEISENLNEEVTPEFHRNGWGYGDTRFRVNQEQTLELSGKRYGDIFGKNQKRREFPEFLEWAENTVGINFSSRANENNYSTVLQQADDHAPNFLNQRFLKKVQNISDVEVSTDFEMRLRCSHGHTLQEVFSLRRLNKIPWRIADCVLMPSSHKAVEEVIEISKQEKDICLVPVGGCTNVTHALIMPESKRCIVAVDMSRMNKILWVDRNNMLATIQAGALGQDIERKLGQLGLTMGHEPDSSEFSSIGGWVATKSSGMKKNKYGNIEDIVVDLKMVTSAYGTLQRGTTLERVSVGPDVVKLAIGSEGIFGIITEVTVRLRLQPRSRKFDSYVFPDLTHGISAMREIALYRLAPSSIRLMDNLQFQMGQALKPLVVERGSVNKWKDDLLDKGKKYYVTQYRGYNPESLCAMTLLYEENDAALMNISQKQVGAICRKYGGICGGPESGLRGYFLTFMIAYLRDFGIEYGFLSESFETSIPWSDVHRVYDQVKLRIIDQAAKAGVTGTPLVAGRVTQTYDTCATIYFYFGILEDGLEDPVATFSAIEDAARDEILSLGGSISHHHGVGKLRRKFFDRATTKAERRFLYDMKIILDPTNLFGASNLFDKHAKL